MPRSRRQGNKVIVTPIENDPTEAEALKLLSQEDQSNLGQPLDREKARALLDRFLTKIKVVNKKRKLN